MVGIVQRAHPIRNPCDEEASRFEDPVDFLNREVEPLDVFEHVGGKNGLGCIVLEGEPLCVSYNLNPRPESVVDVDQSGGGRPPAAQVENHASLSPADGMPWDILAPREASPYWNLRWWGRMDAGV